LEFCMDTFSWGDYIHRVWDIWISDKKGRLLVGESNGRKMALAHVSMCPGGAAWLEGVRVHPDFRRSGAASALLENMLGWAVRNGAREASAIVSKENTPSQRMMERNGFSMISDWAYYGMEKKQQARETKARIAAKHDLAGAWKYLLQSRTYKLSAGRYVSSWQWYPLDRKALQDLVSVGRVVVTGRPVDGLAVINKSGYWDKPGILQIVYLDAGNAKSLRDILVFAANLHSQGHVSFHVICQNSRKMTSAVEKFDMQESEVFLLYNKKLFTQ
jgi:GNAT superfamily N-acetyltransferase